MNNHAINLATSTFRVEKVSTYYNEVNDFSSLSQKIRSVHEKSLRTILKIYGQKLDQFFRGYSNDYLDAQNHYEATVVAHNLSYFAKHCRISSRQMTRHFDRLEEAGLIIRTRTYARVCISINPVVIKFFDDQKFLTLRQRLSTRFVNKHVEIQLQAAEIEKTPKKSSFENQLVNLSKRTSCLIMHTSGDKIKLLNTNVRGLNTTPSCDLDTETVPNFREPREITETPAKETSRAAEIFHEQATEFENKVEQGALELWRYVYNELYEPQLGKSLKFLSFSEEEYGMQFFRKELSGCHTHTIGIQVKEHLRRIRLWRSWINKPKVDGFTPLPSNFFDNQFAQGYQVTRKWRYDNQVGSKYQTILNQLNGLIRTIQQKYHFQRGFSELLECQIKLNRQKTSLIHAGLNDTQHPINRDMANVLDNYFQSRITEVIKIKSNEQ